MLRSSALLLVMLLGCHGAKATDVALAPPIEPPAARTKAAPLAHEIAMVSRNVNGVADLLDLAVKDKSAYWIEYAQSTDVESGMRGSLRTSALEAVPSREGVPIGKVLASFHGRAELAVDAKHAFVAVAGDRPIVNGSIFRVPLAGGAPHKLTGADEPHSLVVDDTSVWYVDHDTLQRVPKSGGKAVRVAGTKGSRIVADETDVWILETDRLVKVAKADGSSASIAVPKLIPEAGLASDRDFLYVATWTKEPGTSFGALVKVPKKGGANVVLVGDQTFPRSILVDATHVYWINGLVHHPEIGLTRRSETELRRVTKDGQGAEVVLGREVLTHIADSSGAIICVSLEGFTSDSDRGSNPMLLRIAK